MMVVDAQIHLWENPGAPPAHGARFTYTEALARILLNRVVEHAGGPH